MAENDKIQKRREVLRTLGVGSVAAVVGCLGESRRPTPTRTTEGLTAVQNVERGLISYNPYKGVDWDNVQHHKSEFHNHVRGSMHEPAEIVDLYGNLEYTVYAVADKGHRPMAWPWTEFSEIKDEYTEDRNPEKMGVVAFPGCEFVKGEHVEAIFTTLNHETASNSVKTTDDQIDEILSREEHHVPSPEGGLAVLNHPHRYYDRPDREWVRYVPLFESYSRKAGFVGLEAFNKEAPNNEDIKLWDYLLSEFAPHRLIWGFATDDPKNYVVGRDVDVRWTTVLLDSGEFDPSDQPRSRVAAANAFRDGRTLLHERQPWDDDAVAPAAYPKVESIDVDIENAEITVEATEYDSIKWVSNGEIVSTNETVSVEPKYTPYVRAHLQNDAATETSTQPFILHKY